jgi:kynurenine formamidase
MFLDSDPGRAQAGTRGGASSSSPACTSAPTSTRSATQSSTASGTAATAPRPDAAAYAEAARAGLDLEAARWLVETCGAVLVGADNPAVEHQPSAVASNPHPVHAYLLRERGVHQLEYLWLEGLAREQVYRFALVCLPLKLSGATASMVRPIAIA